MRYWLALCCAVVFGSVIQAYQRERPRLEQPGVLQSSVSTLQSTDSVSGGLAPDGRISYQMTFTAGQYFVVSVKESLSEVSAVLYRPDGKIQRQLSCWHDGRIRISEIAEATGVYALTLISCDAHGAPVSFTLQLSTPNLASGVARNSVAAERAAAEAVAQVKGYRLGSADAAEKKYEEALRYWTAVGNRSEEAAVLIALGLLTSDLGRSQKAIVHLTRALGIAEELGEPEARVDAMTSLGLVYSKTGDSSKASAHCSAALRVSESSGETRLIAKSHYCMGKVQYFLGDLKGAIDYYDKALIQWQLIDDRHGRARVLISLGHSYSGLGQADVAATYHRRSLELFRLIGDKRGQAECLTSLGNVASMVGDKQQALTFLDQARSLVAGSGDAASEGPLLNAIGFVHQSLGDEPAALEFYKQALAKFLQVSNPKSAAITRRAIGEMLVSLGNLPEALKYFFEALDVDRKLSVKRIEAYTLRNIGLAYQVLGDTEKAISNLTKALELNRSAADRWQEAYTLSSIGHVQETRGEFEQALKFYNEALTLNRSTADTFGELASLYRIAHTERSLGRLQEGLEHSEAAISIIERLRSSVASYGLRTSYFASVRDHYDLKIDFLMRLHEHDPKNAFNVRAFEISERSRARTLLDNIGEEREAISEEADPNLAARERALRLLLDSREAQYAILLSQNPEKKENSTLQDEIRRLAAEFEQVQAQIRLKNPRYASLVQPQPLTLPEIQKQLLDGTLVLEYSIGDENSYLWAITRESFTHHVLPKRSVIDSRVRRLRDVMVARIALPGENPANYQKRVRSAEAQYWREAGELSEVLLGPVADQLQNRRLAIVAEGSLQYLPFAALPVPNDPNQTDPLIIKHEVVSLPSVSTLALLRKETSARRSPDRTLAVLADPVFERNDSRVINRSSKGATTAKPPGYPIKLIVRGGETIGESLNIPRLPGTRQEAETILGMIPEGSKMGAFDFNASRATAMSEELGRYRIVHFATHGLSNDDHPEMSGLILSLIDKDGKPENGFLRLRDIYNLNLTAELVVLSACNTALGKDVKGEGLVGMVRGFMYSGTPRVLASLWKVDDDATSELMKEFYSQLLQHKLGPAAALRQAQIVQMKKKSRQSPYYWAAFQLQGEWQ